MDPATNRMVGQSYDANGNLLSVGSYDTANRMVGTAVYGEGFAYDPFNRKVWTWNGDYGTGGRLYLYGPSGEVLGEFTASRTDPNNSVRGTEYVYFAGRRVLKIDWEGQPAALVTDRLGSGRVTHESHPHPNVVPSYHSSSYYPYGETRSGPGSLFATYTGTGNLRYAMNRWYSSQFGRFTTPDPWQASAGLANPQSWNRYAYVENDPVNFTDRSGLQRDICAEPEMDGTSECIARRGGQFDLVPYGGIFPRADGEGLGHRLILGFVQVNRGGGGGRGRQFDPRTLLPGMRQRAIDGALAKLKPGSPCWDLFNIGGIGIAPDALLSSLAAGTSDYGSIRYGAVARDSIVATTSGILNPPGSDPMFGALITLNSSLKGGWYNSSSTDQAATILHELGHAYNKIYGAGSSAIRDETVAATPEERLAMSGANSRLIQETCLK